MLQSINHLKRVFEKKRKKSSPARVVQNFQTLPQSSNVYQLPGEKYLAYTRYYGDLLKHFGVFPGDVLSIDRRIKSINNNSLYAVLLPNNSSLICAVKRERNQMILHDGRGGNFQTFRTSQITLIGLVISVGRRQK